MSIIHMGPPHWQKPNQLPQATRDNNRAKDNLQDAQRLSASVVSLAQRAIYVFNDIGIDIQDLKSQLRID